MNRLFEASLSRERLDEPGLFSGEWIPLADVFETPEAFLLEIELAGLEKDDIDVHVEGDSLTIRGVRRMSGGKPDAFHRMERRFGPFSRIFQFPEDVDPDRVSAQFKDGLLRLEVPKVRPRGGWRARVERA